MSDFDINTSGTLYVETSNGYEKLAECNNIQVVNDLAFEPQSSIRSLIEEPISFTCETQFNPDGIKSLLLPIESDAPPMLINYYKIQKRRHHKTRINKKWLKRYGYWLMEDRFGIEWIKKDSIEYEAKLTFKERRRYGEELHGISSTFIL